MYDPNTEDKIKELLKRVCQPVTTDYKKEALEKINKKLQQESQKPDNSRERLKVENIVVVVNMDSQTLSGTITLQEGKRLSDFLNGRFPGSSDVVTNPFINLTDVKIYHKDGRKETTESIYINRQTIQMLRTLSENDARGIGAAETREFPYVQKMPVKTAIYTEDYELIGYLHCKEKQDISNVLSQKQTFLPCTDVKIHDYRLNSWDNAAFVAVNSDLVFSIKKEE